MPGFVPLELVNEIFRNVLAESESFTRGLVTPNIAGENPKAPWQLIHPLTLASRSFRHTALSIWFQYLYLRSAAEIDDIDRLFPDIKPTWCRYIHCVQTIESRSYIWNLAGFKRLDTVRVDWLSRELTLLGYPVLDNDLIPFVNVECPVRELDIRGVRYPSPMALRSFSSPFSELVILKLELLRIWCGLCHTCALVRFPSPAPASFEYDNGLGLSVHYSRSFYALEKLEEVHITLPDLGSGQISAGLSATSNENMWAGECDRCMSLMYEDETFRRNWRARKEGAATLQEADARSYMKPPKLHKVRWNFWKFEPSLSDGSKYSQEEVSLDDVPEEDEEEDGEEEENAENEVEEGEPS